MPGGTVVIPKMRKGSSRMLASHIDANTNIAATTSCKTVDRHET